MKFQKQPANSVYFFCETPTELFKIKLLELSITATAKNNKQTRGQKCFSQKSVHSIENLDFVWKIGLKPNLAHDKINGVYAEKSSAHETWKIRWLTATMSYNMSAWKSKRKYRFVRACIRIYGKKHSHTPSVSENRNFCLYNTVF